MSATIALRRESRTAGATTHWAGAEPGADRAQAATSVRRVARESGSPGPGRELAAVTSRQRPMIIVARLWLGVLSMFTLIVCLGLVGMTLGSWALGYRPVVVSSGSMEPSIRPGDVVITRKVHAKDSLGAQTVINFDDPDGTGTRLHRIVEVTDHGYRTKGDANPTADSVIVAPAEVQGTGLVLAPFAGYLPLWISQGRWINVVLTFAGLIAVSSMSRRSWMWATAGPR